MGPRVTHDHWLYLDANRCAVGDHSMQFEWDGPLGHPPAAASKRGLHIRPSARALVAPGGGKWRPGSAPVHSRRRRSTTQEGSAHGAARRLCLAVVRTALPPCTLSDPKKGFECKDPSYLEVGVPVALS